MRRLEELENNSIYIIREAQIHFSRLAMLWSIGKDSTVLLWLCRKAFLGKVPFPLIHIDTGFKIPKMIEYRDMLAKKWKLDMIYGQNEQALQDKTNFPNGSLNYIECCRTLKTKTLKKVLDGTFPRYRINHLTGQYEVDSNIKPYTGLISGIRADEEGSRSKERIFSPREIDNHWNHENQPPEFWGQFNTEFPPDTHVRIHPLLDWTEVDVWKYIKQENIPIIDLYFDNGQGRRYRSLGCAPCTKTISSTATTIDEIIYELEKGSLANVAERSGRSQDKEDEGGLETLRKEGYM